MPQNLTDVDEFTSDVTVPSGGDGRTAASVEPGFQALANRTHYLNLRKAALAGASFTGAISAPAFNYPAPLEDVQKAIPLAKGTALPASGSRLADAAEGLIWTFDANSVSAVWPIEIPNGSTLTAVTAVVTQGNAGASGRMNMEVVRMTHGFPNVKTSLGLTTFAAGTGVQFADVLPVSNNVINNVTSEYFVVLTASALAATNDDYLVSLNCNFDVSGLVSN